jgi:hypothetical protein
MLLEFGMVNKFIDAQRPLILDMVDWDNLKREWETAQLACGLSYVVLAFTGDKVDKLFIAGGFAGWLIITSLVRLVIWKDDPADRYVARRVLRWTFPAALLLSIVAKVLPVFLRQ